MIRTKRLIILLSICIFLILPGCSSVVKDIPLDTNVDITSYPLIIRDDSGAEVIIPNKPQRIISLLPSFTEILFALGQEDNITALTKWDNYPANIQAKGYNTFADALNPDIQTIVALRPDLVLIGSVSGETLRKMRNLDIPVVVYNPQSIEKTYETISNIGYITNSKKNASQIISNMKEKENTIKEIVSKVDDKDKPRVWLEVSSDLFTPGKNTFLDELISKAGGINISADLEGWGLYNDQQVIEKDPQIIFYTYGQYEKNAEQIITNRPGWQEIEAVRNKQIVDLDNDIISRPGPRVIDAMELIAKALYPELFK